MNVPEDRLPQKVLAESPRTRNRTVLRRLIGHRTGGLWLLFALVMVASSALRIALSMKSASLLSWDASLAGAFLLGALFDLGTAALVCAPLAFALVLLPARALESPRARRALSAAAFAMFALLVFEAVAEWIFWDEFGTRFNFIAVDYLVYTREVAGNVSESYPLVPIFAGIGVLSLLLFFAVRATGLPAVWVRSSPEPFRLRARSGAAWLALAALLVTVLDADRIPAFSNNYNRELAKNGLWSLFSAFRANELEYDRFYRTTSPEAAFDWLRHDLAEDGSMLLRPHDLDTLRYVSNPGPERRLNVVQITVESLSAEFLGAYSGPSPLTPNLSALAKRSLVFDRFFATGTRTDRGMEALSLSIPPTPGRSLVKRPRNEDLFSLGSVFRSRGYDTAFLYGGYGYFDNMNNFFGRNGYRVVDRASPGSDVTFANIWGACDEDLYRWTLREADAAHAAGRPFHFFVMTTSNHRPFTYPAGRIDLPPKISGRAGAVKYTDYAIGKFLSDAAGRPWFRDTVFVIVADHCASSAGRSELPVIHYHIPLLVYAPGGQVEPGHVRRLASQIDYAPTLLGLLGWSYPSRFFGHDVRRVGDDDAHALLGNYQKLGHMEDGELLVLSPKRGETSYRVDPETLAMTPTKPSADAEREAVGFYRAASYMFSKGLYRALGADEVSRPLALGSP